MESGARTQSVRFGEFELDLAAGELCRNGSRLKLQEQPLQILQILLERPGKIIPREELQRRLWPSDTFVDFDHGINNAIKRLREALGDTAEAPRYIETLPGEAIGSYTASHPQPRRPRLRSCPFSTLGPTRKTSSSAMAQQKRLSALLLTLRMFTWLREPLYLPSRGNTWTCEQLASNSTCEPFWRAASADQGTA